MLREILALINTTWKEGSLPTSWKQAAVVPILKPGKDALQAGFLHIEKAYGMLWKEELIIKLYETGKQGCTLNWIQDFLKNRTIQVLVVATGIDNGTALGSVNTKQT